MQYIILFFLFIVFPICGIQALLEGDIDSAVFFFSPLIILICGLVVNYCFVVPHQKRQEAAHKMYKLPERIEKEHGEVWDKEFQKVITDSIDKIQDSSKRADLQECQKVAKQMIKDSSPYRLDSPFYKINNAFRLTGCHFTITDSDGKTITQIV